mmetsp:Transcript_42720/g.99657  ORF Transcript_42720/g.99657 Transcript_42720/m.99657 type:complete len:299 (-) Transcript_42720:137-1033(-)
MQLLPHFQLVNANPRNLDAIQHKFALWIPSIWIFPLHQVLAAAHRFFDSRGIPFAIVGELCLNFLTLLELFLLGPHVVQKYILLRLVFHILHSHSALSFVLLNNGSIAAPIFIAFCNDEVSLLEVLGIWPEIGQVYSVFSIILNPLDVEGFIAIVFDNSNSVELSIVVEESQSQLSSLVFYRIRASTLGLLLCHLPRLLLLFRLFRLFQFFRFRLCSLVRRLLRIVLLESGDQLCLFAADFEPTFGEHLFELFHRHVAVSFQGELPKKLSLGRLHKSSWHGAPMHKSRRRSDYERRKT